MRVIVLFFCMLFLNANMAVLSAPQIAVENYFELFNQKNREALNQISGNPFVFNIGGVTSKYDKYGDAVDFDGLQENGWAYSRIHKSELIYEDDLTAMVSINFSRYSSSNHPISTSDVIYVLVKRDEAWKVKAGFVDGDLSMGR